MRLVFKLSRAELEQHLADLGVHPGSLTGCAEVQQIKEIAEGFKHRMRAADPRVEGRHQDVRAGAEQGSRRRRRALVRLLSAGACGRAALHRGGTTFVDGLADRALAIQGARG